MTTDVGDRTDLAILLIFFLVGVAGDEDRMGEDGIVVVTFFLFLVFVGEGGDFLMPPTVVFVALLIVDGAYILFFPIVCTFVLLDDDGLLPLPPVNVTDVFVCPFSSISVLYETQPSGNMSFSSILSFPNTSRKISNGSFVFLLFVVLVVV